MLMLVVVAALLAVLVVMAALGADLSLLQQLLHEVPLGLHGRHDLLAFQLVPVGGDDGSLGVLLPDHGHGAGDLVLAGGAGAAQDDGVGMADLVVVKLAEVLHVQPDLVHIGHGHKAVQLHIPLGGDALHGLGHVAQLTHAGGLDQDAVRLVLVDDLLQSFAEVAYQAAADAAGVHLGDLDAGLLQKAAVDADLAEFILDEHQLLARVGLGDQLLDERGLAGAQKTGKNIDLGHGILSPFILRRAALPEHVPSPGPPAENSRSVSYYTIFVKVIARFSPVFFLRNFAFLRLALF